MPTEETSFADPLTDAVEEVERAFDQDDAAGKTDLRRRATELRDKLNRALHDSAAVTRDKLREGYDRAGESVRAGVDYTEQQIKDHPFAAVGIATGVGLLIGLMINRNR